MLSGISSACQLGAVDLAELPHLGLTVGVVDARGLGQGEVRGLGHLGVVVQPHGEAEAGQHHQRHRAGDQPQGGEPAPGVLLPGAGIVQEVGGGGLLRAALRRGGGRGDAGVTGPDRGAGGGRLRGTGGRRRSLRGARPVRRGGPLRRARAARSGTGGAGRSLPGGRCGWCSWGRAPCRTASAQRTSALRTWASRRDALRRRDGRRRSSSSSIVESDPTSRGTSVESRSWLLLVLRGHGRVRALLSLPCAPSHSV